MTTWLDVFDIRTTGKIEDDLFGIIGGHDMFILLLSPNSVASVWVQQELEVAKSNQFTAAHANHPEAMQNTCTTRRHHRL